jgi:hypothetical protein
MTQELDTIAEEMIRAGGDIPSFKGYQPYGADEPFPASICISVNDEIVHGIPGNRVLQEGDIVGLDLGLTHKGMITDAAISVPVGNISVRLQKLLSRTEEALMAGIAAARGGAHTGDIGAAVEARGRVGMCGDDGLSSDGRSPALLAVAPGAYRPPNYRGGKSFVEMQLEQNAPTPTIQVLKPTPTAPKRDETPKPKLPPGLVLDDDEGKKRKKKKQSKGLVRIWERAARGYARSNRRTADEYLSRHRRSSKKRRDGWLRDLTYNWGRASRKGNKQFKLSKIFR